MRRRRTRTPRGSRASGSGRRVVSRAASGRPSATRTTYRRRRGTRTGRVAMAPGPAARDSRSHGCRAARPGRPSRRARPTFAPSVHQPAEHAVGRDVARRRHRDERRLVVDRRDSRYTGPSRARSRCGAGRRRRPRPPPASSPTTARHGASAARRRPIPMPQVPACPASEPSAPSASFAVCVARTDGCGADGQVGIGGRCAATAAAGRSRIRGTAGATATHRLERGTAAGAGVSGRIPRLDEHRRDDDEGDDDQRRPAGAGPSLGRPVPVRSRSGSPSSSNGTPAGAGWIEAPARMRHAAPPSDSECCACPTSRGTSSSSGWPGSSDSGSRSRRCRTISSTGPNPPSPWFEGWTALTGLAGTTSTIRLATCVTQIPFRNPAVFARQALTLDHVSGGRLEIGLGTGLVGDPSYADGRHRRLGAEGAGRAPGRIRRDRRPPAARRGDDVRGHLLPDGWRDHEPASDPDHRDRRSPSERSARSCSATPRAWPTRGARCRSRTRSTTRSPRRACGPRRWTRHARRSGRDPATLGRSYTMYDAQARPRGGTYDCYESTDRFEEMAGRDHRARDGRARPVLPARRAPARRPSSGSPRTSCRDSGPAAC